MNAPQTTTMDSAVNAIIERLANGEITMDEAAELLIRTMGRDSAFQLALGIIERVDKQ